jgi:hypothetical protein
MGVNGVDSSLSGLLFVMIPLRVCRGEDIGICYEV